MENDFGLDEYLADESYDTGIYTCPFCKGKGTVYEEHMPVATEPLELLEFLAGRMEFAGIGEAVAQSYARNIRQVLEHYKSCSKT